MSLIPEKISELLLDDLTLKEFGYSIFDLSKGSKKKIYSKCVICKKPKQTVFRFFIQSKALSHQQCVGQLRKQVFQKKYGVSNPSELQFVKQKKKQTSLRNYQVDHPMKSLDVQRERKQRCLKKYGVEYSGQVPDIRKKRQKRLRQTFKKRRNAIVNKRRITSLQKYGVDYPNQSQQIRRKTRQTSLQKYGVDYPTQSKKIQKKIRQTKINRYGVAHPGKHELYSKQYWLNQGFWDNCKINPSQDLPDQWSQGCDSKFEIICSCSNIWSPTFNDFFAGRSRSCGHNTKSSQAEQDIYNYIKDDLNIDCLHRHKIDGVEFDVYIPSKRIAIEYNGLVWHSELFATDPKKDYNKCLFCKDSSIRYVGIYEDEWLYHQNRVKNYLRTLLGFKPQHIVRPQKLNIVYEPVGSKRAEIKQFLDQYHYAGGRTTFQHVWKCYHQDTLIAVLGVGSPTRQNIKEDYEIKRFCLHNDYRCYGLWSFLLKRYVKPLLAPCTLTSFSDNRRDTGKLYEKLGFERVYDLRPDYYWIKQQQRFHKSAFKKNDHIRSLNLTERQYWESQGYSRLWDCGKAKWSLRLR